ncbi:hypothetical protein RCH09_000233 [Actimicrobium sp. GrIS 1.19]|uniref:DUF4188 domain-containing protein n=1 Tax=Actimicrobium sp. GrIS 1.19 TaxID=3071708 RepID=UPI002DFD591D|nr:hypothetical protein [Actimicrobium sp. GrIS 1.19]
MIQPERMHASLDGDFVVFLIGMRINRFWKIHKWLPVTRAMPRMLKELAQQPELGLLSYEMWFGRTLIMVQYWRSAEQLLAYATSKDAAHLPAWKAFNQAVGTNGDVGIWHETYRIAAGASENIYVNMPPFGLGRAGTLRPVSAERNSARQRFQAHSADPGPTP